MKLSLFNSYFYMIKGFVLKNRIGFAVFILFSAYFLLRFGYFTINAFNYDENWHSGYMNGIFSDQVKLYQAFSPLYWMFGHVILKIFGNFDISFGRVFLRLVFSSFYLGAIFIIYKTAKKRNADNHLMIFLVILLILSAPISFFGGKMITPEYLQLILFTICLYNFSLNSSDEKKWVWFMAGIAAGLKMHALATLPFFFFFRSILLSEKITWQIFFINCCKISKIAVPFAICGLLLANFPLLVNFHETIESLKAVGNSDFNIFPKLLILFNVVENPQCWESICPFYVRDGHSQLIYNLLSPLSGFFIVVVFVIAAKTARNIAIFFLFIFSIFLIQVFIATGYANYPWYHIAYLPLLLSLLLHLKIRDLSKLRQNLIYILMFVATLCNLLTTSYMIRTDYAFRKDVANLIQNNAENTACIDEIISNEKPNAYVFSVISVFDGYSKTFIDVDFLRERYFKEIPLMFNQDGILKEEAIEALAKHKSVKLLFSIDDVSSKYNQTSYEYKTRIALVTNNLEKQWRKEFPSGNITSKINTIRSCSGITNYIFESTIN